MKPEDRFKILVVDDSPQDARVMLDSLSQTYDAFFAIGGPEALRIAEREYPDLTLLDIYMDEMDGFEVCRRLKRIPEIADNPVIFITGSSEEADHVKGLEMGAVDFIAKPINITVLKQRVALHLRLISAIKDALIEIEARKRAEKMLQKSERLYRMLAENITDVIWTVDENQNYTYVSPSIFNLLGYNPEELLGNSLNTVLAPGFLSYVQQATAKAMERLTQSGGQPFDLPLMEYEMVHKSGQRIWVEVRNSFLSNQKGIVNGMIAVTRDISERKDTQRKIVESEKKYRNLFENGSDLICLHDLEGKLLETNLPYKEEYGWQKQDLEGRNIRDMIPERHRSKFDEYMVRILKNGADEGYLKGFTKSGEEVTLEYRNKLILDVNGKPQAVQGAARDVTQRIMSENKLKDSEEKYRTLVEQSLQGVIVIQDNLIVFTNKAFSKISGYSIDELYSLSPQKVVAMIHPEDQDFVWGHLQKRLAGEIVTQQYEFRGIHKDGSERFLEIFTNLISYDGNPAIQGTIVDITERKQAEMALKISESNYRELFHADPDAIIIVDSKTKHIVDVNSGALELYGYDYDEMCGLQAWTLSAEPEKSAEHIQQVLTGGSSSGGREIVQHLHKSKDGSIFPVEIAHGFYIRDGRKMICAIMRDISERKRAEDEIAAQKERLTVTLRSIGDGVISTDIHGKIISTNKVAEALTGWKEKEAIGMPLTEVFHIVDEFTRSRCEDPVRKVIKTGGIVGLTNNTMLISKDGHEYIIADSGAPIMDRQNKIIGSVLVFRDITEKRKMQQELVKAQKLESLGVLAGGIAHDFNNFLTAIIGNLSLAKLYANPSDRILSRLDEMEKASLNAKNLTQQLLTFSKGGEPIKKLVTLPKLVKDAAKFSLRGSNVRCDFSIPGDLLPVEVDEGQIGQVINNLVLNADHAMPEGGIIKICINNITLTANNKFSLPAGPYLKLSFQDHGVGIPTDHLSKIFDPYFTTKQKGSGLGLTVAYSIINKHNGGLTVESEIGKHTTFTIYLPASQKPEIKTDTEAQHLFIGQGKILVMDDEDFIREVANQMLSKMGCKVSVAKDGNEAIEIYREAQQSNEPFDAVIMDLTVPGGMGGKEAIQKLKELDPNIKTFVSSGYSNDPIMSNFRDFGFEGVLKKPYRIQDMSEALRTVIKIQTE
jgi:PAS domain S-box-containing protein